MIVWRDGREQKLTVTVGRTGPNAQPIQPPRPWSGRDPSRGSSRAESPALGRAYVLGLELATLNPELAQRIEFPRVWRGALVL